MRKLIVITVLTIIGTILFQPTRPGIVDASPVLRLEKKTVPEKNIPDLAASKPVSEGFKKKPVTALVGAGLGMSDAKMFIYKHESGNNPGAVNPNGGACGLGQALPCSKMPCSLSDYACQDNFFTQYMQGRYGSWENAKAFWLSHGAPCNNDVGWCGWW